MKKKKSPHKEGLKIFLIEILITVARQFFQALAIMPCVKV